MFETTRYVLVARNVDGERLATCGTPRSLTRLYKLLRSLFLLYPAAAMIDVLLWTADAGQRLEDQEILLCAERNGDPGVPSLFTWYRERDLRAIEQDIAARATVLADAEMEEVE